jgi:hypothetical protein
MMQAGFDGAFGDGECGGQFRSFGWRSDNRRGNRLDQADLTGLTFALAGDADRQILHHRIKEGGHPRGETEAGEFAQEITERFLHHVQCIVGTSRKAVGKTDDPITVTVVESVESSRISSINGSDKLGIGTGVGRAGGLFDFPLALRPGSDAPLAPRGYLGLFTPALPTANECDVGAEFQHEGYAPGPRELHADRLWVYRWVKALAGESYAIRRMR